MSAVARANAAFSRLRGYRQQVQRYLRGSLASFLDCIVQNQLAEHKATQDRLITPEADTEPGTSVTAHVNIWYRQFQDLYSQARSAHNIMYEAQGVTPNFREAGTIIFEIESIVDHLGDLYCRALSSSLESAWRSGGLAYQRLNVYS